MLREGYTVIPDNLSSRKNEEVCPIAGTGAHFVLFCLRWAPKIKILRTKSSLVGQRDRLEGVASRCILISMTRLICHRPKRPGGRCRARFQS